MLVRQQAITSSNADQVAWRHMASPQANVLKKASDTYDTDHQIYLTNTTSWHNKN